MYLDEPQVRAALEDPRHVGIARASLELSSSDAAWNPDGDDDIIGPASLRYKQAEDGSITVEIGQD